MDIAPPATLMFDEILTFIASSPSAEQIIAFEPSDILTRRLHNLLDQNSEGHITSEEREELDEFQRMNHFLKMLKIKARQARN
jgi:hypothetical protein